MILCYILFIEGIGGKNMNKILENEIKTYKKQKDALINKDKDRFALIKDNEIIDTFETKIDAIRHGYDRFGNVPFLVKKIQEVEIPQNFASNLLGA